MSKKLTGKRAFMEFYRDAMKTNIGEAVAKHMNNLSAAGMSDFMNVYVFVHEYYKKADQFVKEQTDYKEFEFTKHHEQVIMEFCRDLMNKPDNYDRVLNDTLHKIERDERLRNDAVFRKIFKETAEELKPKKSQKTKFDITPSQDLVFNIRIYPGETKMEYSTRDDINRVVHTKLMELFNNHLPEHVKVDKKSVDFEMDCIKDTGELSLASRVALMDIESIEQQAKQASLSSRRLVEQYTRDNVEWIKVKTGVKAAEAIPNLYDLNKDKMKQYIQVNYQLFKKNCIMSKTEVIDQVRDMIIGLNKKDVTEYERIRIVEKTIEKVGNISKEGHLGNNAIKVEHSLKSYLKENRDAIIQARSAKEFAEVLKNTYEIVLRIDKNQGLDLSREMGSINAEVKYLMKGVKPASVQEGLYEVQNRRDLYICSKAILKYLEDLNVYKIEESKRQSMTFSAKKISGSIN